MSATAAEPVDVVVALGSRMAGLEGKATRWREVLRVWADDPRVGSLTVLDYPRYGPRPSVRQQDSWLPGTRLLDVRVLGRQVTGPETALGWRLTSALVRRALPGQARRRVVVAATPLWVPLLPLLPAARRAFDGVDDWRAYPAAAAVLDRVEQGYAGLRPVDAVTAVSAVLAERLGAGPGVPIRVVGNGIHRQTLADATPSRDPRLPEGLFALYVGNVEQRVDLDLLEALAVELPVVVAGPASGEVAERLTRGPLLWLGQVHASDVPGLLTRAAVGLLPHRHTALTESMDPMKLLEYLGAGLPVVSTALPGLTRWSTVEVAEGEDFVRASVRAASSGRQGVPEGLVDWTTVAGSLLREHAGGLLA